MSTMSLRTTISATLLALTAACGTTSNGGAGGGTGPDEQLGSAAPAAGSGSAQPDPGRLVAGRPVTTEIQRRQAAACESLGPKITACAIEDAKASMTAEAVAKLKLEETAPRHTQEFIEDCIAPVLTSRQVRVYEVCQQAETECEPLLACLEHVNDAEPTPAPTATP